MKKQCFLKGVPAFVLAAALLLMQMFIPGMAAMTHAADGEKTISGLGTGTIENPFGPGVWGYVYYGKYNNNPVKYRVLSKETSDFGGKSMLLDCDSILLDLRFDNDGDPNETGHNVNEWAYSDVRKSLNGNDFLNKNGVFTESEKEAIVSSTKKKPASGDSNYNQVTKLYGYAALDNDKVFLLDAREATREDYGYDSSTVGGEDSSRIKGSSLSSVSWWWLRSPSSYYDTFAAQVRKDGNLERDYVYLSNVGVSPAFNVNLSSVIFSSEIPSESGSHKLTVKDSKMSIKEGEAGVSRSGNTITVPYVVSGNNAGNATQVSVLLTDKEYSPGTAAISGYTYLKLDVTDFGTTGTGTFTLPGAYAKKTCGKDYYAYILAEDVNGAKETDYASAPVAITIPMSSAKEDPVPPAPEPTSVSGTPVARMTAKGKTSLTISWMEVKGAAGYDIFFSECNHNDKKSPKKNIKTINSGKTLSWTKKGLKKGSSFKACVKAFVMKNGKKVYVGTSPAVHAFTGGYTKVYTNAKAVKVNKTKVTLSKGKTIKIKAKVIKLKKDKKLMPKSHAPKLRYLTTDKKIATVSSKGKIKAKGKGTCYVYVYAHNGVSKKIKVTVK